MARTGGLAEAGLLRVHELGATLVDHTLDVRDPDVLFGHPQIEQQIQAGQGGRTRARHHQLDLANLLAHHGQPIDQRRRHNNGRAVLVIMEDGNLHALAKLALDVETVRCLDVFEVDATKGRLQGRHGIHDLVEVSLGQLNVKDIDARELLEEHALAFHHGLGCQGANVAQAEHCGAVGHHAHQVPTGRVLEGVHGVLGNL